MTTSHISPARIVTPDAKLIRSAKEPLTSVAAADDGEKAEGLFAVLIYRAGQSLRYTDAGFAAARMLRDSGVLTLEQAVYVFDSLWQTWKQCHRPADVEVWRDEALHRAEFFRARGEDELADFALDWGEAYQRLCKEGLSLIDERRWRW